MGTANPVTEGAVQDTRLPTQAVIVEDGDLNDPAADPLVSSNDSIASDLEGVFGRMWFVTVGAIVLVIAMCCCFCGYALAKRGNGSKQKEGGVAVIEGDATDKTGVEMMGRVSTLEPSAFPNNRQMYL